ncbi:MAG TPA: hypothetical protein VNZ52_06050, partial [Candidatus Thermoplasmatota archaeon]|nr:hypothetical protein [Candidatus Thermoplasmatota archaeon]
REGMRALAIALGLVLLALAAGGAAAQDLPTPKQPPSMTVLLTPPPAPVDPGNIAAVPVVVEVTVPGPTMAGSLTVTLAAEAQQGLSAAFASDTLELAYETSASSQVITGETVLRVGPEPFTPAGLPLEVRVLAVTEGNNFVGYAEARAETDLVVAFAGTGNVTVGTSSVLLERIQERGTGAVYYRGEQRFYVNGSFNADAKVVFDVLQKPAGCLVALGDVTLARASAERPVHRTDVMASLQCEGADFTGGPVGMRATFSHPPSGPDSLTLETTFEFLVTTDPAAAGGDPTTHEAIPVEPQRTVPAAAWSGVAALALAGLALRRWRSG